MLHFGKTPDGELEIRATGDEVGTLYRAIAAAHLPERGTLYGLKSYMETEFRDHIK